MKKLLFLTPLFLFATNYYNKGLYAYQQHKFNEAKKYFLLACEKNKNAWGCFSYAEFLKGEKKRYYLNLACKYGLKVACQ